jgi:hypothetical protein
MMVGLRCLHHLQQADRFPTMVFGLRFWRQRIPRKDGLRCLHHLQQIVSQRWFLARDFGVHTSQGKMDCTFNNKTRFPAFRNDHFGQCKYNRHPKILETGNASMLGFFMVLLTTTSPLNAAGWQVYRLSS